MRITHVIRAKPPGELGGADLHVLDLAAAQVRQGHDVRVILLGPAEISGSLRERGIPSLQIDSMSMVDWVRALRLALRADPTDVLHTHGYRADIIAAVIRPLLRGVPRWRSVVTVHGFIRTSPGLRVLSRLNESVLRQADVVIAVSSAEAQRLAKLLRRPVCFIPNGVAGQDSVPRARAMAKLGSEPSRRVVAFLGRLSPEKRPDLFVDMAGIVARDQPATDFVVIGSGSLLSEMQQRAAAMTGSHVVFAGLVSNVASLMEAIDVLVCPSDTEGTPRAVIEAMLAGVPVVATRVGGVPDLIADGQTGVLVEPGSPSALAAAVNRLLRDETWARAIGDHARALALTSFSVEDMADRVAEAYQSDRALVLAWGTTDDPGAAVLPDDDRRRA
ncbi:MAG: glycosyltransferase family 4 protein [Micromonosporaceae bacterium]